MKPTKEIIELSKRLKELGYEQGISHGSWVLKEGFPEETHIVHYESGSKCMPLGCIPIPSLEDGLEWLTKKKGFTQACYVATEDRQRWSCFVGNEELENDFIETISHTSPHEAVLKAMVKVLEN